MTKKERGKFPCNREIAGNSADQASLDIIKLRVINRLRDSSRGPSNGNLPPPNREVRHRNREFTGSPTARHRRPRSRPLSRVFRRRARPSRQALPGG